jgi:hypothetical protein
LFSIKNQGQGPGAGHIHRLKHRADIDRAIAEIGNRNIAGLAVLVAPGCARRHRHAAADNGVGA